MGQYCIFQHRAMEGGGGYFSVVLCVNHTLSGVPLKEYNSLFFFFPPFPQIAAKEVEGGSLSDGA